MKGNKKKILVHDIKEKFKPFEIHADGEYMDNTFKQNVDLANVFQTILSKQLPPERFDGIIALWLSLRPDVPEKEIEDALVSSHSARISCSD